MVVDTLENLEKYASLNPLFAQAIEFLKSHDFQTMEIGKTELKGKDLLVNIAQTKPKTKEEAKLETHRDFIDIQIPLSGTEIMGYTAAKDCIPADAPYNTATWSRLSLMWPLRTTVTLYSPHTKAKNSSW